MKDLIKLITSQLFVINSYLFTSFVPNQYVKNRHRQNLCGLKGPNSAESFKNKLESLKNGIVL